MVAKTTKTKTTAPAGTDLLGGDKEELAEKASRNARIRGRLIRALADEKRGQRILASRAVHSLAIKNPALLKPFAAELADALDRPEAQTRWEILGALEKVVAADARVVDKSIPSAIVALHDVESGVVRLAAFRLLAAYGATTPTRSDRVWPYIDEAIRVYHGDPEFPAMLIGVIRLVSGSSSDQVKMAAAERMEFDSEHGKGLLARRAKKIVACAPKKRRRPKKVVEE